MSQHKTRKDRRKGTWYVPVKPHRKEANRKLRRMKGVDIGDHGTYKKIEDVRWNAF